MPFNIGGAQWNGLPAFQPYFVRVVSLFFTGRITFIYTLLKLAHVLATIVWIGGMVFAHFFLRPAVMSLEVPDRVRLMHEVLRRFFNAVSVAVLVTLVTGLWMIGRVAKQSVQSGAGFSMPLSWTLMAGLGILMMLIFAHIRFALFKRLRLATQSMDWDAGAVALASIRTWVAVNMGLGVLIVALVTLLGWVKGAGRRVDDPCRYLT